MQYDLLIIEDDPDIAELTRIHLEGAHCSVRIANNGTRGYEIATSRPWNLIILDLTLPGMDGLEICRRLRSHNNFTPILMLTAKTAEVDRVQGLELGADDYLTKPFSVLELVARVKAIIRRVQNHNANLVNSDNDIVDVGDFHIDTGQRLMTLNNKELALTTKEFDLMLHFAQHPGHVFSRSQLLDTVWGYQHDAYEHTVNSHINRLRTKIEDYPSKPRYIVTVRGVGYKLATVDS